jgi:L-threonylcarbamoyladenylate synthase
MWLRSKPKLRPWQHRNFALFARGAFRVNEVAMQILSAQDDRAVSLAAKTIANGDLVILPTETVYGLGASALQPDAVAKIYAAKGRPAHNPLIAHVANRQMAEQLAIFDDNATRLINAFWPGPLTLVLPRADNGRAEAICSGHKTIAVRQPQGIMADISSLAGPIAAPSANLSGKVSAARLADIASDFERSVPLALDGGPTEIGLESTIAKVEENRIVILRPGAILAEELANACRGIGVEEHGSGTDGLIAPGMMRSHYAPRARLRLNAKAPSSEEAWLAFGPVPSGHDSAKSFQLSETADLTEAASRLYTGLHMLDETGVETIAVAPIPRTGIGIAINDRLARAAAPRA